ncbi:MAG: hypothetical protein J3K34DRAFT_432567, partial [Monoraphidium minutum]
MWQFTADSLARAVVNTAAGEDALQLAVDIPLGPDKDRTKQGAREAAAHALRARALRQRFLVGHHPLKSLATWLLAASLCPVADLELQDSEAGRFPLFALFYPRERSAANGDALQHAAAQLRGDGSVNGWASARVDGAVVVAGVAAPWHRRVAELGGDYRSAAVRLRAMLDVLSRRRPTGATDTILCGFRAIQTSTWLGVQPLQMEAFTADLTQSFLKPNMVRCDGCAKGLRCAPPPVVRRRLEEAYAAADAGARPPGGAAHPPLARQLFEPRDGQPEGAWAVCPGCGLALFCTPACMASARAAPRGAHGARTC